MSTENAATKVVIGPVRFSYLHVWEPTAMEEGQKKKFSGSFLIPKSDKKTIAAVKAAIEAAKEQGKSGKWGGKIPAKLEVAFYDGDVDKADKEEYAGCFYVNAKSDNRPGIVDKARQPIVNQDEVQSGDYGFVSIVFYPYDFNGKKGVAAALNNVMKTKTGERFSSISSAEDDFADLVVADDEDDII